jgi:regulator of nucleoside diphosphate kinase
VKTVLARTLRLCLYFVFFTHFLEAAMSREPKKKLILLDSDVVQLRKLLQLPHRHNLAYISALKQEIDRAEIVPAEKLPSNVITMNSRVLVFEEDTMESAVYILCYPWEANADENKISVLAPVGTAILGYRKGDTIEWTIPAGVSKMKIMSVQQPVAVS